MSERLLTRGLPYTQSERSLPLLASVSADADGSRDAASHPIDHRVHGAVQRAGSTTSVIKRRQALVDVESTWPLSRSSSGVRVFARTFPASL